MYVVFCTPSLIRLLGDESYNELRMKPAVSTAGDVTDLRCAVKTSAN